MIHHLKHSSLPNSPSKATQCGKCCTQPLLHSPPQPSSTNPLTPHQPPPTPSMSPSSPPPALSSSSSPSLPFSTVSAGARPSSLTPPSTAFPAMPLPPIGKRGTPRTRRSSIPCSLGKPCRPRSTTKNNNSGR